MTPVRLTWPLVGLALSMVACGEGPQGPAGPQGEQGPTGDAGDPGDDGFNFLLATSDLDRGDDLCPFGGVLIDGGLDNGEGGGTARDGVLQPGEVDSSDAVCAQAGGTPAYEPSDGAPGAFTFDATGGDSAGGFGGEGGQVSVGVQGPSGGGVLLLPSGQVDASFTFPSEVYDSVDLGSTPFVVSADRTLEVLASHDLAASGAYYMVTGNDRIYHNLGTRGAIPYEAVTGVRIDAGVTLTVGTATGSKALWMLADFDNAGTLTTGVNATTGYRDDLYLTARNYFGRAGSKIDLPGALGTGGTGEGGALTLRTGEYLGTGMSHGGIYNEGTFDARGASGAYGAEGGNMQLYSPGRIYNTGDLLLSSGSGTTGGGDAEVLYVYAGGLFANSGSIESRGGPGGDGGIFYLYPWTSGSEPLAILNSGTIDLSGGDETAACDGDAIPCNGGRGGYLYFQAEGGDLLNSGDLLLGGGDAATGNAGYGGYIQFYSYPTTQPLLTPWHLAAGSIGISGDVDISGGTGAAKAGRGGNLYAWIYFEDYSGASPGFIADGQTVTLQGYAMIDASGGDAARCGYNGDYEVGPYACRGGQINAGVGSYDNDFGLGLPAIAVNEIDLDLSGGDSTEATYYGGDGGYFNLYSATSGHILPGFSALNFGTLDLSGGTGAIGGYGGSAEIMGSYSAANHAPIRAPGGAGGVDYYGGGGGWVYVASLGMTSNSGAIDITGADAGTNANGGSGGTFMLDGRNVDSTGAVDASGGNAQAGGGDGGDASLVSTEGFTLHTPATADNFSGGTGTLAGASGGLWIDGILVEGTPD